MKKKIHQGNVLDRKDGLSIISCISCGFTHVSPLPEEEELRTLYEKKFYQKEKPNYFKETKEDLSWWMATYQNYYTLLEKHTKGRKILDIGSGPGHFLLAGKKRGWDVLGIEPSPEAYDYTKRRKLPVLKGFFNYEMAKEHGPFDVVHASMVLEHIPNPINFLGEIKKLVKPNGLVAIFCPNDYNPLQMVLKDKFGVKPWWVSPRHHLNYFDVASMKKLLVRLGFEIEESLGTFPLEFFILSGDNYVGNPAQGRKCHAKRKKFEMNLYKGNNVLLNELYRTLAAHGVGREFMIIARKKT